MLFDEAVGDRLRTDRVGSQLSGGMDSTSIAVTAHRLPAGDRAALRSTGVRDRVPRADPRRRGQLAAQVAAYAGFPVEVLNGETSWDAEPQAESGLGAARTGSGHDTG